MSAWTCHSDGKAAAKIVPPHLRIPSWKGLGADSEEKHEPVSDIYTAAADSLKALDPERPIREADINSPILMTARKPLHLEQQVAYLADITVPPAQRVELQCR